MHRTIFVLIAVLAVAQTAAAGPSAPACYACFCGTGSATPQYCHVIEENNDYPPANDACRSACNGPFQFQFILAGNFCPSPPCQNHAAPAMSERALALTAVALLSFGVLYLWRRTVRR
jgi:hypothetical protein